VELLKEDVSELRQRPMAMEVFKSRRSQEMLGRMEAKQTERGLAEEMNERKIEPQVREKEPEMEMSL
jgi:hypothetical protein